ncbi:MAG: hypothetical protein EBQ89_05955 [Alphaproteobacteria bacterium]|nr:hypothetical protein [Alphaproteobacteria bacterium]
MRLPSIFPSYHIIFLLTSFLCFGSQIGPRDGQQGKFCRVMARCVSAKFAYHGTPRARIWEKSHLFQQGVWHKLCMQNFGGVVKPIFNVVM